MSDSSNLSHEALERIFHEPVRLAIMSRVCAAEKGRTFGELKEECNLTAGNLNRHLKALEETGAVRIKKAFKDQKPCTSVHVTAKGLDRFSDYLTSLSDILITARDALPKKKRTQVPVVGRVSPA